MADLQGPEEMNTTCRKTMHRAMMDMGFTVPLNPLHTTLLIKGICDHFNNSVCTWA
jgi:hypothetical protein